MLEIDGIKIFDNAAELQGYILENPEVKTDEIFYDCGEDSSRVRCVETEADGLGITIYAWKMQKLSNGKDLWIKYEMKRDWEREGEKFYSKPDSIIIGQILIIEY